jgi:hypothetical protein
LAIFQQPNLSVQNPSQAASPLFSTLLFNLLVLFSSSYPYVSFYMLQPIKI